MTSLSDLRASLPIDQIAARLGENPDAVRQAIEVALPALLGGLQANAADPAGATSLVEALGQHGEEVATPPIDVTEVDAQEGEKITAHIFGAQQDQVVQQLGSTGAGGSLVRKLLPILAPIVLSYLAKQMGSKAGAGAGTGALGSILSSVLAGATQGEDGNRSRSGPDVGGILGDLLGGLLGGGRKA